MDLKENMARFLRSFAEKNKLSMAKIQEKANISRNMLYAYFKGEGNPTFSTVEYIAVRLDVNPLTILMGIYDPDGQEISVLLVNTVQGVAALTQADRRKFLKLFILEMMKLWDEP